MQVTWRFIYCVIFSTGFILTPLVYVLFSRRDSFWHRWYMCHFLDGVRSRTVGILYTFSSNLLTTVNWQHIVYNCFLIMYCIVSYCVLCLYLICYLYTNVSTKVTRNKHIYKKITIQFFRIVDNHITRSIWPTI
jgi:hypothetical protein